MNQLSLDLKFPWEAEQIALDLDFKPCKDYDKKLREEIAKSSVNRRYNIIRKFTDATLEG